MIWEQSQDAGHLCVVYRADLESVNEVVSEGLKFAIVNLDDVELFGLELVMREGLNNSVKHGSKLQSAMKCQFDFILEDEGFLLRFSDNGDGFDWQQWLEKIDENVCDIEATSGRGIFLMEKFGYQPLFNEKGNVLILRCKAT